MKNKSKWWWFILHVQMKWLFNVFPFLIRLREVRLGVWGLVPTSVTYYGKRIVYWTLGWTILHARLEYRTTIYLFVLISVSVVRQSQLSMQKIFMQGGKGGGFLGGFPKKYYPNLAWRLVTSLGVKKLFHLLWIERYW